MKINSKIKDWNDVTHKQLYLALKEKETIFVNIKNVREDLTSWKDIAVKNKPAVAYAEFFNDGVQ